MARQILEKQRWEWNFLRHLSKDRQLSRSPKILNRTETGIIILYGTASNVYKLFFSRVKFPRKLHR